MKRSLQVLLLIGFCSIPSFPQPASGGEPPPANSPAPPPSAPAQRSAADLEKLVSPIALHPDPLIAVLLPAAVYPLEIVQAARFVKDTNNIAKLDSQPWDDNVKAVARFPELISKMDADLTWTAELGQAFIDQPKEVMDMIQNLRTKAQTAGTLRTTPQQVVTVTNMVVETTVEQQVVVVTNTVVQIQPSNPEVIYVPSYPPTVYYPPPGYVYDPYAPLVGFGVGLAFGAIIANNCDWHGGGIYVGHHGVAVWGGGGDVDIDIDRNTNINVDGSRGNRPSQTGAKGSQQKWQPDQNRMRTSGAAASTQTSQSRGWGSGGGPSASQQPGGARPSASTGAASPRPSTGTPAARPSTGTSAARPSTGTSPGASRPSTSSGTSRPSPSSSGASRASSPSRSSQSSAFGGVSSGRADRSYSNRAASSRSAGGGGGRGGGGRR